MRVLLIGSGGTIGTAIAQALSPSHQVVGASRSHPDNHVDIRDPASIVALFRKVGTVDAVIVAAGSAAWKRLAQLTDEDFRTSLDNKLMGQVNVVRLGIQHVSDNGAMVISSGILSQRPSQNSVAVSLVNSALEGFTRAAALDLPRGLRVNCVSPPWVSETLAKMGADPRNGLPAAQVARTYLAALEPGRNGQVMAAT